uniref:Uncharacterized protein n=1 Tax=Lepeophtheirus salmonis TaxID=72036 RepID=A0A0K2TWB0_LEPSM
MYTVLVVYFIKRVPIHFLFDMVVILADALVYFLLPSSLVTVDLMKRHNSLAALFQNILQFVRVTMLIFGSFFYMPKIHTFFITNHYFFLP